jgi:DNA repair exonuclease SbcCD nuclease subunit
MNFIHIADTHLGRTSFQKLAEDGSNLRETLIYENFLAAIERIIDEQPDALVHAGDLFDTVKPKTKALLVAMQALEMLKDAGIPFIVIEGNHSMPKNAYTTSVFEILKRAHPELHVAYNYKYDNVQVRDTLFHLIPNLLHPGDYKKAAFDAESCLSYHPGIKHNVLVTHGLASTIRDRRLSTVAEFELTPEVLSEKFDYIALGHYHGQMQVAPNAWYSGSIEHLTYGEIKDKKGGLQVWIENGITTVDHFSLVRSPMKDLGWIDCAGLAVPDIIDHIDDAIGLIDGIGDQMFQITLDFGNAPIKALPADVLADYRKDLLDLKIRVRSQETEHHTIQQQDLKAIDYVKEFGTFLQHRQLADAQRAAVEVRGTETLKTVMANHAEVLE